ncbi:MAG: LytTR family transcriptional regulator [Bacteroidales bacterium]|nr:LytTR family transcriptional regulator [Bacteroidales bacterium]
MNKPFDFFEHRKNLWILTAGCFLFWIPFIYLYGPLKFYTVNGYEKVKNILLFIVPCIIIVLVHFFIIQKYIFKKFTIGTSILWFLWIDLLCCICSFLINAFVYFDGYLSLIRFLRFTSVISFTTIMPAAIILLVHYIIKLRLRISLFEIGSFEKQIEFLQIFDNNNRRSVKIPIESILYISSADNYIVINYNDNNKKKHKLLRNTLSAVEEQLIKKNVDIKRCHKSYLVNLQLIKKITGNAAGYKIQLKGLDNPIPVSKSYKESFIHLLKQE